MSTELKAATLEQESLPSLRRRATKIITGALIADCRNGHASVLAGLGCTPAEMRAIQQLRVQDLYRLDVISGGWIDVSINHEKLRAGLAALSRSSEEEDSITEMLKFGASYNMMTDIFAMGTNEVRLRRQLLGLGTLHGRTRLPNDDTREAVLAMWHRLRQGQENLATKLLQLARLSGLTLAALWLIIKAEVNASEIPRFD